MVTRFVTGKGITPEAAAEPEMLGRIARAIRRYHEGPAFPGSFSAFETVRGYHELARARGVRFPETAPRALAILGEIERALVPPAEIVPCHNDLLAANFIDDGAAIRILDWEYAGMGDPYFDLGNFAANQKLSPAAAEELLRRYLGKPRRQDLARLQLMRLASDMRESFWGFLQAGISKLDFDFLAYGREHLERFLKAAAAPAFGRWIEVAGR